jgi:tRNA(fMet)-specific endonuclease VapC
MIAASFLLDTDWVIDHFNDVKAVTNRLRDLQQYGMALSVVSVAELWEGVHFSRDPKQSQVMLEEFLSGVVLVAVDQEICKLFGQLRGALRKKGQGIADFDLLIASSALRHNLTLLTNNRRHFENIEGLKIESR